MSNAASLDAGLAGFRLILAQDDDLRVVCVSSQVEEQDFVCVDFSDGRHLLFSCAGIDPFIAQAAYTALAARLGVLTVAPVVH